MSTASQIMKNLFYNSEKKLISIFLFIIILFELDFFQIPESFLDRQMLSNVFVIYL